MTYNVRPCEEAYSGCSRTLSVYMCDVVWATQC